MYNCPTFFLFWKCLADMSYWTNGYLTVADNELHFLTISNLNYKVFVSLAHIRLESGSTGDVYCMCMGDFHIHAISVFRAGLFIT